jgi:hypothetical protein
MQRTLAALHYAAAYSRRAHITNSAIARYSFFPIDGFAPYEPAHF